MIVVKGTIKGIDTRARMVIVLMIRREGVKMAPTDREMDFGVDNISDIC
jgi:hypothetical protein